MYYKFASGYTRNRKEKISTQTTKNNFLCHKKLFGLGIQNIAYYRCSYLKS